MGLLNLTLGQFLIAFGAIAAFSVSLYLLDRSRRRQVVSTLRFWVMPGQPAPVERRRRIQQPLSLLLQLIGMLLLLLAIADLQFGNIFGRHRDHVLILDTSAWMTANAPGRPNMTLMDVARGNAVAWLRAVPANDRVLLVRADGLATPAGPWETDHRKIVREILESQPGATALNMAQSITFSQQAQRQGGGVAGEIVYDGPGRISAREAAAQVVPSVPAFRILPVDDALENVGLRSVGARHSATEPGVWDILVRVRNYGRAPKTVSVTLNFGSAPQGNHSIDLLPNEEKETTFPLRTVAAGAAEIRLYPKDGFGADNYASLELPPARTLHVTVYSDRAEILKAALTSDHRVEAEFHPASQYNPANDGLIVIDRFRPATLPQGNSLWIDPPSDRSPVPVKQRVEKPKIRWIPDQPLTAGLRARDAQVDAASVFDAGANDIRGAEIDQGAVMVARTAADGKSRMVVLGFDPFSGGMRFELATPLLLGNTLRWMAPEVYRQVDVATQAAGSVSSPVSATADASSIQILNEAGGSLPFNLRDRSVQFFAGESARVRLLAGNVERVYSLTLPEMWDAKWTPPANAKRGIPAASDVIRRSSEWWPWLALLGAGFLAAEWIIYGQALSSKLRLIRGGRMERAA